VAKHSWLPRRTASGLRVHVDSLHEAHELAAPAARDRWRVGLRCHVPAEHDRSDPRFPGQFGLARDEVGVGAALLAAAGVAVEGIHFHLGQGRRQPGDYGASVDYVVQVCRENSICPRYIDCGGGMADGSHLDAVVGELNAAVARARRLLPTLEELWIENGRYLTERSAALVIRVLDIKVRGDCRYLICDGGRTNQALAADEGLHTILVAPAREGEGARVLTTIVGPTCMTDDRLGRVWLPDTVERGDLLVWLDAGAYHLPWETRFSQGWCAVAWADSTGALALARPRETPEEWASAWRA
jgi:diaminopimelate decarboxylase